MLQVSANFLENCVENNSIREFILYNGFWAINRAAYDKDKEARKS
jgi:hypothetical protein